MLKSSTRQNFNKIFNIREDVTNDFSMDKNLIPSTVVTPSYISNTD